MENPLAEFNIHVYLLRLCVLNQYKSSIWQIQSNHLVMLCLYIYVCIIWNPINVLLDTKHTPAKKQRGIKLTAKSKQLAPTHSNILTFTN